MPEESPAFHEPLIHDATFHGAHSRRLVLTLASFFIGLSCGSAAVFLSGVHAGPTRAVQEPIMAIASPYMQAARAQQFMPTARVLPRQQMRAAAVQGSSSPSWLSQPAPEMKQVTQEDMHLSRREAALSAASAAALLMAPSSPAVADAPKTVLVAGATGQTGRRVLERLAGKGGLNVIGGVRDVDKAAKTLNEASVTVRGAMVQNVPSVDTSAVTLTKLNVVDESASQLAESLKGSEALVIATGFIPGNPFEMGKAAKAVDNEGTVKLVDAAKAAGVPKVVMISSILTDAGAWGQRGSPGFVVTNAFGGVLDEKLAAEKYLRASGLDYTIVRPGGLKATPAAGKLIVSGENTLKDGEISRDLVADVMVSAVFDSQYKNKVVEIIEEGTSGELKPQDMVGSGR
eukprot:gnl/MRDRNA2_/MRDRNA2_140708_c0_seq1.p1 gnl/MRDRNA2_/MRDRNA2_140708_c0~~gnl/MRDRNA2_/MRDRNA2_140708_c0_seq1.p1  ORF type:complete len:402 (+),score=106.60 gnl/MRDRNA2_/MRDRNA2_140708_c0_seq1:109-1314(+)